MPGLLMPSFHRKAHRAALERSAKAKKDHRSELSGLLPQTTSKLDMPAALSILSVCTALSGRYRRPWDSRRPMLCSTTISCRGELP